MADNAIQAPPGARDVKRRARLVCLRCHEKKIKCDIQNKEGAATPCSHCRISGAECCIRASRRKGAHRARHQQQHHRDASLANSASSALPLSPASQGPSTQASYSPNVRTNSNVALTHHATDAQAPLKTSPQEDYHAEPVENTERAYLGQSGFMAMFSASRAQESRPENSLVDGDFHPSKFVLPPALKESFVEAYLEYCYPWCPVLTKQDFLDHPPFADSLLLQQGLGLLGSLIKPPLIKHASPPTFYDRFKLLFYDNHEQSPLTRIIAIMLMYWWSAGPPNVVSMDSQFWWTSVAIRMAQEIGLHKDPPKGYTWKTGESPGLRRRVWWTLYARERLTAICQGRPCIIHPDDCDIAPPTLDDFPANEAARGEVFIHWVRICDIMGKVSKHLNKKTDADPFPGDLARDFIGWIHHLPEHLRLPLSSAQSTNFNRDVHQLHLPYLTGITLLHMSRAAQPIPRAYIAAVLSASCVARIFEDLLARGSLAFMSGTCGWYVTIAILALLHARRIECLRESADEQIEVLFIALKEIAKIWHSAKMFLIGFQNLLRDTRAGSKVDVEPEPVVTLPEFGMTSRQSTLTELINSDGENYLEYFPGANVETSNMFAILLSETASFSFPDTPGEHNLPIQLQDLFDQSLETYDFDTFAS